MQKHFIYLSLLLPELLSPDRFSASGDHYAVDGEHRTIREDIVFAILGLAYGIRKIICNDADRAGSLRCRDAGK